MKKVLDLIVKCLEELGNNLLRGGYEVAQFSIEKVKGKKVCFIVFRNNKFILVSTHTSNKRDCLFQDSPFFYAFMYIPLVFARFQQF